MFKTRLAHRLALILVLASLAFPLMPARAAVAYADCRASDGPLPCTVRLVPAQLVAEVSRGAPEDECIDLTTSLVFSCSQPTLIVGGGVPVTYVRAIMHTNVDAPDCDAQLAQWCASFNVAVMRTQISTNIQIRNHLRADAWVVDTCFGARHTTYAQSAWSVDGVLTWADAPAMVSACGTRASGTAQAFIDVFDTSSETDTLIFREFSPVVPYRSRVDGVYLGAGACFTTLQYVPDFLCQAYGDHVKTEERDDKGSNYIVGV